MDGVKKCAVQFKTSQPQTKFRRRLADGDYTCHIKIIACGKGRLCDYYKDAIIELHVEDCPSRKECFLLCDGQSLKHKNITLYFDAAGVINTAKLPDYFVACTAETLEESMMSLLAARSFPIIPEDQGWTAAVETERRLKREEKWKQYGLPALERINDEPYDSLFSFGSQKVKIQEKSGWYMADEKRYYVDLRHGYDKRTYTREDCSLFLVHFSDALSGEGFFLCTHDYFNKANGQLPTGVKLYPAEPWRKKSIDKRHTRYFVRYGDRNAKKQFETIFTESLLQEEGEDKRIKVAALWQWFEDKVINQRLSIHGIVCKPCQSTSFTRAPTSHYKQVLQHCHNKICSTKGVLHSDWYKYGEKNPEVIKIRKQGGQVKKDIDDRICAGKNKTGEPCDVKGRGITWRKSKKIPNVFLCVKCASRERRELQKEEEERTRENKKRKREEEEKKQSKKESKKESKKRRK